MPSMFVIKDFMYHDLRGVPVQIDSLVLAEFKGVYTSSSQDEGVEGGQTEMQSEQKGRPFLLVPKFLHWRSVHVRDWSPIVYY